MANIDYSSAENIEVITNNPDVTLDPAGYFLIRINESALEAGFCNYENKMLYTFKGINAQDISKAIALKNLKLTTDHSLYLGRELQRAEDALRNKSEYIQD